MRNDVRVNRADDYPELDRPIRREEYEGALESARRHGLTRLDQGALSRRRAI